MNKLWTIIWMIQLLTNFNKLMSRFNNFTLQNQQSILKSRELLQKLTQNFWWKQNQNWILNHKIRLQVIKIRIKAKRYLSWNKSLRVSFKMPWSTSRIEQNLISMEQNRKLLSPNWIHNSQVKACWWKNM